jgi:hypothetical protein
MVSLFLFCSVFSFPDRRAQPGNDLFYPGKLFALLENTGEHTSQILNIMILRINTNP